MCECNRACLRACVLACLRACVLACLRACVLACLRACVLACLHISLHECRSNHELIIILCSQCVSAMDFSPKELGDINPVSSHLIILITALAGREI